MGGGNGFPAGCVRYVGCSFAWLWVVLFLLVVGHNAVGDQCFSFSLYIPNTVDLLLYYLPRMPYGEGSACCFHWSLLIPLHYLISLMGTITNLHHPFLVLSFLLSSTCTSVGRGSGAGALYPPYVLTLTAPICLRYPAPLLGVQEQGLTSLFYFLVVKSGEGVCLGLGMPRAEGVGSCMTCRLVCFLAGYISYSLRRNNY